MISSRLTEFLIDLGAAMSAAGDATTFVTRALERIGRANGLRDLRVSAGPTLLLLRYANGATTTVDLTTSSSHDLRLDQVSDIYRLLDEAEDGRVGPEAGIDRLHEILGRRDSYGAAVSIFGLALISGGLSLVLSPSIQALLGCICLGVAVGMVKLLLGRVPSLWPLVPVVSACIVSGLGFLLIKVGVEAAPASLLIPPLATFLPGAAITVGMIELAAGDIVSGGSRLAAGVARLLFLVLGVVIATQLTGASVVEASRGIQLPAAVSAIGLISFTAGVCLHFGAPVSAIPWLLAVVGAAFGTQEVAGSVLGSYLGAVLGGTVMVIVAALLSRQAGAPPLIVCYTPAFWLLVPASLGLQSLTQIAQGYAPDALADLLLMLLTMIAIALGMLLGLYVSGNRGMQSVS